MNTLDREALITLAERLRQDLERVAEERDSLKVASEHWLISESKEIARLEAERDSLRDTLRLERYNADMAIKELRRDYNIVSEDRDAIAKSRDEWKFLAASRLEELDEALTQCIGLKAELVEALAEVDQSREYSQRLEKEHAALQASANVLASRNRRLAQRIEELEYVNEFNQQKGGGVCGGLKSNA